MPLDDSLPRFSVTQCSVCGDELPTSHTGRYCDECDPFLQIVACPVCGLLVVAGSQKDEGGHRCPAPLLTPRMKACFEAHSVNPTAEQCPGPAAAPPLWDAQILRLLVAGVSQAGTQSGSAEVPPRPAV